MELARLTHADDFLAAAGDFLGAREAEHNLMLGLSSRLRESPRFYGEDVEAFIKQAMTARKQQE